MKKFIIILVVSLCFSFTAYSQSSETVPVISDDLNFIAFFPAQPAQTEESIETLFGKGYSRKWTLELPDVLYEVSVDYFPELSVNMDYKSLNSFYDVVCSDFTGKYKVKARCGSYGQQIDFFDEYGKLFSSRSKNLTVSNLMFLARQRLYQVKVIMKTSIENDKKTAEDIKKFTDDFLLVYRAGNEKNFTYGLPESLSQNLKREK